MCSASVVVCVKKKKRKRKVQSESDAMCKSARNVNGTSRKEQCVQMKVFVFERKVQLQ